jgi:hypothetical protein
MGVAIINGVLLYTRHNPLPVADPSACGPLASAPAARPPASRTRADRAAATPDALPGLARLLMRRAAMVGGLVLLLALVLGLARMGDDIGEEVDAGMALATAMATLGRLPQASDAQALAALAALAGAPPLRHLVLEVHAADGRPLLAAEPPAAEPWWERGLLALHRRWLSAPDARHVDWVVPRPDSQPWRVTRAASHEAERREAGLGSLGGIRRAHRQEQQGAEDEQAKDGVSFHAANLPPVPRQASRHSLCRC